MALYVSAAGDNTTGAGWATAYNTVETAFAAASLGEIIYVDSAYANSTAVTKAYNGPTGSAEQPCLIISVDKTGDPEPPTTGDYLAGATETSTGSSADITFGIGDGAIFYGFTFESGDNIGWLDGGHWRYRDCKFRMTGTGVSDIMDSDKLNLILEFDDTTFRFGNAQHNFEAGQGSKHWFRGCSIEAGGTAINELYQSIATRGGQIIMESCDWSGMVNGAPILGDLPTSSDDGTATFLHMSRCKLPTSGVLTDDTFAAYGTRLEAYSIDSGDTTYKFQVQSYEGAVSESTATYRTATYDGTNGYSAQMVSTAQAIKAAFPLRFKLSDFWAAADPTLTVELTSDSTLTRQEFWLEIEYPKVADGANGQHADTLDADRILGSGTTLTTSVESWTSAKSNKYAVAHTIADGQAGVHTVWVNLAPSAIKTVYVDPHVDIT